MWDQKLSKKKEMGRYIYRESKVSCWKYVTAHRDVNVMKRVHNVLQKRENGWNKWGESEIILCLLNLIFLYGQNEY